jgi:shikimate dehydrogenase
MVSSADGGEPTSDGGEPTTRRAAVLGRPIEHSLSPLLHRAAYRALGLTGWSYERFDCGESELAAFVAGLGAEWVGLSLTMPLKRVGLELADDASAVATAVGAANTLLLSGDRSWADNTDVAGMVDALREGGSVVDGSVVILGAGGTAQAALAAVEELGAETVTVVVRDRGRAVPLTETAERLGLKVVFRAWGDERALAGAGVVVSTVPAGVGDFYASHWPSRALLFDVLYSPWPTSLATAALAAGSTVVSGARLLLYQAAHQVELMTGLPAPVEAMRTALRDRTG